MNDLDFLQHLDAIQKHLWILNQSRPSLQLSKSYELLQQLFTEVLRDETKISQSIHQESQPSLVKTDSGSDGSQRHVRSRELSTAGIKKFGL
ncbi:hypothetical protein CAL7716_107630 (plasmid) [Calothrix sp. PCC 7716]|nr:hypothetical protein CAL7716_107630 [Calothrix sp. PCC 7716]